MEVNEEFKRSVMQIPKDHVIISRWKKAKLMSKKTREVHRLVFAVSRRKPLSIPLYDVIIRPHLEYWV